MLDRFRRTALALALLCGPVAGGMAAVGLAHAQAPANPLAPGIAPYAPKMMPPRSRAADGSGAVQAAGAAVGPVGEGAVVPRSPGYDYVLGPGDKLRITVFEEEDLSGEFGVAGNGKISFPLIGEVTATGRTVQQVQDTITARLKDGYVKDPRVSAEVLTFRPFFILGEVAKPGEYPYMDAMTVLNAVATAGGFTYRANRAVVFVKGVHEVSEHKVRLKKDVPLQPGDTVRVGARLF